MGHGPLNPDAEFCCGQMSWALSEPTGIEYWRKFREFGVRVLDGGSSIVTIKLCPWCGTTLPLGLRAEWFERLDKLGVEPEDAPEEMLSELWWRREGI